LKEGYICPEHHFRGELSQIYKKEPLMNKKNLKYFKTLIMQRRQNILEALASQKEKATEWRENYTANPSDKIATEHALNTIFAVGTGQSEELRSIDVALKKIKEGTYGICEICGKDISIARLKAVPFARLCISCQETEEKRMKESHSADWQTSTDPREMIDWSSEEF
jgi:DnaK suppressor protein